MALTSYSRKHKACRVKWKHVKNLLTLLNGNDLVVSENFLDEATCSFSGELAVA
jgi:hypothetical protein